MFEWRGRSWQPKIWCLSMAWDAWRIAMGYAPSTFTRREVEVWIAAVNEASA